MASSTGTSPRKAAVTNALGQLVVDQAHVELQPPVAAAVEHGQAGLVGVAAGQTARAKAPGRSPELDRRCFRRIAASVSPPAQDRRTRTFGVDFGQFTGHATPLKDTPRCT